MDPDEFWATDDFPTLSQKVEPSPPEDTVEDTPIEEPGKDDLQINRVLIFFNRYFRV